MISLTAKAVTELMRIKLELNNDSYLRVGCVGGGCAGFSYNLGFDDGIISDTDQVFESEGLKIVCDAKSFLYLNGLQIDFEEGLMKRGFKFINPNSAKDCGCGTSFSI